VQRPSWRAQSLPARRKRSTLTLIPTSWGNIGSHSWVDSSGPKRKSMHLCQCECCRQHGAFCRQKGSERDPERIPLRSATLCFSMFFFLFYFQLCELFLIFFLYGPPMYYKSAQGGRGSIFGCMPPHSANTRDGHNAGGLRLKQT
jgi:hypothetical protein